MADNNEESGPTSAHLKGTPQKLAAKVGKEVPSSPAPGLAAVHKPRDPATPATATLKRALNAQNYTAELALDLSVWISHMLPNSNLKGAAEADDVFGELQTGVELCDLVNRIAPEYKLSVNRDAKAKSFEARDNIDAFLKAARKMGVPPVCLFETDDLVERKSDKLVVNTLLQLSDAAADQFAAPRAVIRDELRAFVAASPMKARKGANAEDKDAVVGVVVDFKSGSATGVGSTSGLTGTATTVGQSSQYASAVGAGAAGALSASGKRSVAFAGGVAGFAAVGEFDTDAEDSDDEADAVAAAAAAAGTSVSAALCSLTDDSNFEELDAAHASEAHHSDHADSDAKAERKARRRTRRATRPGAPSELNNPLKLWVALALTATHGLFFYLKRRNETAK